VTGALVALSHVVQIAMRENRTATRIIPNPPLL
jgi:hypothetical protein